MFAIDCIVTLVNNTIAYNTTTTGTTSGGGVYAYPGSSFTGSNNIVYFNSASTSPNVGGTQSLTYSCWAEASGGMGNINGDPLFVNAVNEDFHLQSTSPCIDTGNPLSPLDPDGSRTDMGVYPFDHSVQPQTLDITTSEVNPPITIPANGGSFQYNISIHNLTTTPQTFAVWNKVRNSGNVYTQVWGPVTRSLPGGANPSRILTQTIASSISSGTLYFISYVGTYPNAVVDSSFFTITKSTVTDGNPWIGESFVTGDVFDEFATTDVGATHASPLQSENFVLLGAYPNPFNPTTTIRYELRAASGVTLEVFNVEGRVVGVQHVEPLQSGAHEITFDGSGLPSGVYLYKLEAGEFTATQKMVLMK
ncbi:MAG: T9SS type A sorting domain-containing protein [bacterium]|nr:T9SS type A sorting domain-containing protein [bacterium]